MELAAEVGAATAVFRPLYPVGVATRHLDELMPSFAEYSDPLARIAAVTGGTDLGFDLRHIDPFSPAARDEGQAVTHVNLGCGAGNLVASVSVGGDVNPCSFLGPQHVAGNLRGSSLGEIWHHSAGFQGIRELPGGNPAGGSYFAGGCRGEVLDSLAVSEHGLRFRYIPAGSYLMGSADGDPDEQPVHVVRLEAFWLTSEPVSWGAYCELLDWLPPPSGYPWEWDSEVVEGFQPDRFHLQEENKIRLQYCEDLGTEAWTGTRTPTGATRGWSRYSGIRPAQTPIPRLATTTSRWSRSRGSRPRNWPVA